MKSHIYFSTYIIIWSLLYKFKIIKYNPYIWLIIALLTSFFIILYLIYNNASKETIFKYIIYNSPKLILLFFINKKNICKGFNNGILFFIIYLYFINFDLKNIYFNILIKDLLK
jgi:hypothetical protein